MQAVSPATPQHGRASGAVASPAGSRPPLAPAAVALAPHLASLAQGPPPPPPSPCCLALRVHTDALAASLFVRARRPFARSYTIENNLGATHNVLCGIVESGIDIHLVHLGTMGVYGYGNSGGEIPEGYIDVILPGDRKKTILHPAYPGSIYHATKCLDALLFQFYAKNDQLRLTDLHQGIVWGTNTPLTAMDPRLTNRFDYDGEYGTVLNRFLMQAACGIPLTVYGTGGQTRAFIHITDTCRCIELACTNPPAAGQQVEILNQVAQTARVRDVAEMVAKLNGAEVSYVSNPRQEDAENELVVANNKFKLLGLDPILLDSAEGLLTEVQEIASKFADRCDQTKVVSKSYWNKGRAVAAGEGAAAGAPVAK